MAHFKVYTQIIQGSNRVIRGSAYSAVPGVGTNEVGLQWRDVVREFVIYSRRARGTQAASPVNAATQTALDTGALYEWAFEVSVDNTLTPSQTLQAIRDHINTAESDMIAALSEDLRYWGFEGDS